MLSSHSPLRADIDTELRLMSGPGIGVNRNLSVVVVDMDSAGRATPLPILSSALLNFSYAPPQVRQGGTV